ncbi:MAG: hypothetical protein R3246_16625, partial [Acidimicrobiia bacterium]|nr:hypothetical protein [Acidimicrobiia bacterium]
LYVEQKQEVDPERRLEVVHEMVRLIHDNAAYIALWYSPDLQAYRTDAFEGWVRQPEDIGPVIFSNSSPSYTQLRPVGDAGAGAGGGLGLPLIIGGVVVVAALAALALRRQSTVDERE